MSSYLPQESFNNQPDTGMLIAQPFENIPSLLHEMGELCPGGRTKTIPDRRRQAVSILDDIFGDNSFPSLNNVHAMECPQPKSDTASHMGSTNLCKRKKDKEPLAEAVPSEDKIDLPGTSKKDVCWTEIKPMKSSRNPEKDLDTCPKDEHPCKNLSIHTGQQLTSDIKSSDPYRRDSATATSSAKTRGTSTASTSAVADTDMDNEHEMFGAMLTSSTFCEEAQPSCSNNSSIIRKNKKDRRKKQTPVKGVRVNRNFEEEKNGGDDFDDLENWGRVNLNHRAPIDSESLFS
ncbi:hypothetical protein EGW08_016528 [Elysia chlorotica]|uniref:Uncharacterized protein n=1 Tax=Elysia chlorotica TaxID=188477 RepID=A0A3S1B4B3_ELYCH|nr:hypothetical protein EGW08_016528 [Elysia chlorotica]